jgi:hypothetical protein
VKDAIQNLGTQEKAACLCRSWRSLLSFVDSWLPNSIMNTETRKEEWRRATEWKIGRVLTLEMRWEMRLLFAQEDAALSKP